MMPEIHPLDRIYFHYYSNDMLVFRRDPESYRITPSSKLLSIIYYNLNIESNEIFERYHVLVLSNLEEYITEVKRLTGCTLYPIEIPGLVELTPKFKSYVSKKEILFEFPRKETIIVFNERDAFDINMRF